MAVMLLLFGGTLCADLVGCGTATRPVTRALRRGGSLGSRTIQRARLPPRTALTVAALMVGVAMIP